MRTLIVDPVAPAPYNLDTLRGGALGGTEATVIRIAEGLDARVLQHNRAQDQGRYLAGAGAGADGAVPEASHVVVLREPAAALAQRQRYPQAPIWLWLHDLSGPGSGRGDKLLAHAARLAAAGVTLVCVSDFHAGQVRQLLAALAEAERPRVVRIYNPVDVDGVGAAGQGGAAADYDPNKLAFFSSPHKGLDYTLHLFRHLHKRNPALRLYLANPGYRSAALDAQPGVVNLGAIPHHVLMQHLRSALCAFYPNYVYPETFGLVLAESNAVGTPVLTHGVGAAAEVLSGPGQLIAVPRVRALADSVFWRWPALRPVGERGLNLLGAADGYAATLRRWQHGERPRVSGQPRFALARVLADWRAELAGAAP
ncbi:glycosyltransferase family 4 protein [Rugamonas sp. CCM 8940]|uniref:glycosyltransferase family 4 protein n=1 Tax=Rugamonas sp. CCM 8940 TaxID=2765359 RepID=UPI0018F32315|nr:glycosyltransferase family 4 protein [Rugamonas sp. CCM 8940]MBJ7312452.1 glycosyltransferase family 4 protein [Rugamonas sp. CCM 8940]